jgi:hypothetical protein
MDARWNNDVLNPAFSSLTADDFEAIALGWGKPTSGSALALAMTDAPTRSRSATTSPLDRGDDRRPLRNTQGSTLNLRLET